MEAVAVAAVGAVVAEGEGTAAGVEERPEAQAFPGRPMFEAGHCARR